MPATAAGPPSAHSISADTSHRLDPLVCRRLPPAYARALTQHSHLADDRTDWYSARRCRTVACGLTQRSRLVAARTL